MKTPNVLNGLLGLAISFAVVYGYAYVAGKGWKKSQQ